MKQLDLTGTKMEINFKSNYNMYADIYSQISYQQATNYKKFNVDRIMFPSNQKGVSLYGPDCIDVSERIVKKSSINVTQGRFVHNVALSLAALQTKENISKYYVEVDSQGNPVVLNDNLDGDIKMTAGTADSVTAFTLTNGDVVRYFRLKNELRNNVNQV